MARGTGLIILFHLFLGASSLVGQTAPPDTQVGEPFPLEIGTEWVYEGTVWWTLGRSRVYEERVTWTMSVTDTIVRGDLRATVLNGHPTDLATFRWGRQPSGYLLIEVGSGRYYLLGGEHAATAVRRLHDLDDSLVDLVEDDELVLDLPLEAGNRFCSAEQITREDGYYCWVVEDAGPTDLRPIQGAGMETGSRYTIALWTLLEHHVWGFVPGVGFTSYAYGHHGDVAAVEVELVEIRWPSAESVRIDAAAVE